MTELFTTGSYSLYKDFIGIPCKTGSFMQCYKLIGPYCNIAIILCLSVVNTVNKVSAAAVNVWRFSATAAATNAAAQVMMTMMIMFSRICR